MFVRKEKSTSGERMRTVSVSAPFITTQHTYTDLVDEDLVKQLKIQAAIAEWVDTPTPAMIDKKKHVTEDIKATRKKQKPSKKSSKKDSQNTNTTGHTAGG